MAKVGKEIRDKVPDPLLMISQLADVCVPTPGSFSATSHAYKKFLDKGGVNEIIDDKLADESFYEVVDMSMTAGTETRDKTMDPP